jgi:hypothetical protein
VRPRRAIRSAGDYGAATNEPSTFAAPTSAPVSKAFGKKRADDGTRTHDLLHGNGSPAEKAGQWPRLLAVDAGACAGGQCLYLR